MNKTHKLNYYEAKTLDREWSWLFKVAGVSALMVVVFVPIQMVVFFLWPPPDTVLDWYLLFQRNWLIGLLDMDLLLIVDYILLIFVYLALYVVLKRVNKVLMTIATVFAFLGTATYFASTAAFEMLTLSNQYEIAGTDVERSILLSAGHTMLANWQGTAFNISYILGAVALLIISIVMLQGHIFNKVTAYIGIVMGILMLVPPTAGSLGVVLSLLSLVPMIIWLILIALRFFKLGSNYEK